jgi:hypothetical protein
MLRLQSGQIRHQGDDMIKLNSTRLAFITALSLATTGCATLFASSAAPVTVMSQQPGVPITVDGMPAGQAPTSIMVNNHMDHVISSPNASCRVTSDVRPLWIVLDVLAGFVPLVVDAVTSDWKEVNGAVPCVL